MANTILNNLLLQNVAKFGFFTAAERPWLNKR